MAIFEKEANDLIQNAINSLSGSTGLTSVGAGTKTRALIETMGTLVRDAYDFFETTSAMTLIYTASGKYLDFIGSIFGMTRKTASAAFASSDSQMIKVFVQSGTFGDINNAQNLTIPANTRVYTTVDGLTLNYYTTAEVILSSNASYGFIPVKAEMPSSAYNVTTGQLKSIAFSGYTDYRNNSLKVTNIAPVTNGFSEESDDDFRYRISNEFQKLQRGNEMALLSAAYSVPGVADAFIIPNQYGLGTTTVLLKGTTPSVSQSLIDSVEYELSQIKSAGTKVYVVGPKELYVRFIIKLAFRPGTASAQISSAEEAVKNALYDKINNLDPGDGFLINELADVVRNADYSIQAVGFTNKYFEKIYIDIPVLDTYLRKELITDFSPGQTEKLLLAPTNPVTFI